MIYLHEQSRLPLDRIKLSSNLSTCQALSAGRRHIQLAVEKSPTGYGGGIKLAFVGANTTGSSSSWMSFHGVIYGDMDGTIIIKQTTKIA